MSTYNISDEHKKLFIGPKANYYLRKWMQTDDLGRRPTWNLSATLFSVVWLAYRRMYTYCAVLSFLLLMIFFVSLIFETSAFSMVVMFLAALLIIGFFGNNIYRYHMKTTLYEIYATNLPEEVLNNVISSAGGVNPLAAFVEFFLFIGLIYLLFCWFNLIPDYLQPVGLIKILVS